MSEYVELKTARGIVCSVCEEFAPPGGCPEVCAWMRRLKENAADVVEVVRRKDCEHFNPSVPACCGVGLCERHERLSSENDFCNHGKRRTHKC